MRWFQDGLIRTGRMQGKQSVSPVPGRGNRVLEETSVYPTFHSSKEAHEGHRPDFKRRDGTGI